MTYGTYNRKNWRQTRKDFHFGENRYFSHIEKVFFLYHRIVNEVQEIRSEQNCYLKARKEGGGSSNHAFISDPTAQMAIKNVEKIKKIILNKGKVNEEVIVYPEDWLIVVEKTFDFFKNEPFVLEILNRRYLKNESMAKSCIDMELEPTQYQRYYRARNAALRYARECAIQLGLIKIF